MKKITIQTELTDFQEPWGGVYHEGEQQPFPSEVILKDNQEWGHTREDVERVIKANANKKFGAALVSTDPSTLLVTIRFFKDEHDADLYKQDSILYKDLVLDEVVFQGSAAPSEYTLAVNVVQQPITTQVAGIENIFEFNYNSYWGGDPSDLDTEPGIAILKVDGEIKENLILQSGGNTYSFNVGKYILEGSYKVQIEVKNSHGKSRDWTYTIQALTLSLSLSDSYLNQQHIAKESNWGLRLDTEGLESTVFVSVDGGTEMIHTGVIGSTTFNIDENNTLAPGIHTIEAWAINSIYGLSTEHVITHFIKKGSSSNVITLGVDPATEAALYDVVNIPFYFYAPNATAGDEITATINLKDASDNIISSVTETIAIDNNLSSGIQNAVVNVMDNSYAGQDVTLIISIPDASVSHTIRIKEADIVLQHAAECKVYYQLGNKTNSDADVVANDMKSEYEGIITSHLRRSSNFRLKNDAGFIVGEGGCYIPPGKTLTLEDWQPFATNFGVGGTQTGKTISIEFKAGISSNNNIPLISCMDDRCGFNIYPNRVEIKHGGSQDIIISYFAEGERVSFTFVVNGTTTQCINDDGNGHRTETYKNLAFLYMNGVMVRIFEYLNESWEQIVKKNIVFGSVEAGLTVYSISGWDKNITMSEIVGNYAYDTPILEDKIAIAKRNNILLSDGKTIDVNKLRQALPYTPIITWFMEKLPTSKKDPQECKETEFVNPMWDKHSTANAPFTAGSHEINGDGTSSNAYPLPYKNWAEKFSDGVTLHLVEEDEHVAKYSITYGIDANKGEKKFVHKVNFASSEGIFNILAMNMYQELTLLTYKNINDLLSKQQQSQLDAGHGVTFRKSLSGFPEIGLRKHTVNGEARIEFLSIYNFINNKKTGSMFGMEDDYTKNQLWEVDENRNFFLTPMTEHTIIDGHVVESNGVRESEPLYYSRFPDESPINGGDLGMCADITQVTQANKEIKALRHIHNWIVSISPNVAERYKARYGHYRALTVEEDGWTEKDWGDGIVYTEDSPQYRAHKFLNEYNDHLHINDCIFYFVFCVWILGKDSMDKNMSLFLDTLEDFYSDDPSVSANAKVKLRIMLRDTDTTNMFNNTGVLLYKYWHEWNDTYNPNTGETGVITGEIWNGSQYVIQSSAPGATPVFNGRLSGLWDAIVQYIPNQVRTIYQTMRNAGLNTQGMMDMYQRFHDYWCEVLYNVDGLGYANTGNLNMAYGDKYLLSKYFYKYRQRYMDSKYGVTNVAPRTTMRLSEIPTGIWLKHATPMYASFSYGANDPVIARSIVADTPAKLPCNAVALSDAACYINDADLVTEIGIYTESNNVVTYHGLEGIKNFHFDQAGFGNLVRLRKFIWANTQASPNIAQTELNGVIDFTNLKNLQELVMTYCTNWHGAPIIGSEIIEKIDFRGTPISAISVPETETLTELHLPATLTALNLRNLPNISTFSIDGVASLATINIENTAGVVNNTIVGALLELIDDGGTPSLVSGKLTLTSLSNTAYWKLKETYASFEQEHDIDIFVENDVLYFEIPNAVYLKYGSTELDAGVGDGGEESLPSLGVVVGTLSYTVGYELIYNGSVITPIDGVATTPNGSTLDVETGEVTSCNNVNDIFSVRAAVTVDGNVIRSESIDFSVTVKTYPIVSIDGKSFIVKHGNFTYNSIISGSYTAEIQSVEWVLEGGSGLVSISQQSDNNCVLYVPVIDNTTLITATLNIIVSFKTHQIVSQKTISLQKFTNAVDMGLPSGTLWASSNIDVTTQSGFAEVDGNPSPFTYDSSFFSWGNTDGHSMDSGGNFDITWDAETYANTDGAALEGNIPLSQDAARVHCGAPWRMPTVEELNELLENVIYVDADGVEIEGDAKGTTVNGINGVYMKSKINGNLLFIPFAGRGISSPDKGSRFRLWSSTLRDIAKGKQIESYTSFTPSTGYNNGWRYTGASIRPVM